MKIIETVIPDVIVIEPTVFGDERGFFYESFNEKLFQEKIGRRVNFVQDNHSRSSKGVLRGLHYQVEQPQGKLVRVVTGAVFDVAVDIRRSSSTYGKWVGVELTEHNKKQLWIPEGFAHGFLVLSETADFLYKTSDFYAPHAEKSILWNDSDLNIQWPIDGEPSLSQKDKVASLFANAVTFP